MITIEGGRCCRVSGQRSAFPTVEVSPIRALESLVIYEFGHGGRITDISPTRLEVSTSIGSYDDTTIFHGTAEEMLLLIDVAAGYLLASMDGRTLESTINQLIDRAPEGIRGHPLFVTRCGPSILGSTRAHVALLAFCQVVDDNQITMSLNLPLRDLFTIVQFVIEGECSFTEGLALSQTNSLSDAA
jgi:hypothetical protein